MQEATADVSHPVKQGLVQTISVFIDTILICTTTAFMLLNYGIYDGLQGMPYVQQAIFSEIGEIGIHFITISIFLFAFHRSLEIIVMRRKYLNLLSIVKIFIYFRVVCILAIFSVHSLILQQYGILRMC